MRRRWPVSDWRTLLEEFDRVEPSSAIPAGALARAAELEPPAAPQAVPRWLRWTAAGALTTLVIVVLALAAHTRRDATPATPRHVDTGIFSMTQGWITLSGQQIIGLNPADPTQTRVLSQAGVFPIAWHGTDPNSWSPGLAASACCTQTAAGLDSNGRAARRGLVHARRNARHIRRQRHDLERPLQRRQA